MVRPLRRLILGGEAPRPGLFNRLHALLPECTIDNHYGPTETTVGVISHRSTPPAPDPVPLSRVFAGSRVSVRELEGLELVPEAVPGELCIAGANVSRGYWRRPDLTAEKFVPDPDAPSPGARMYRSGDRAVRRGDGSIGLRGRFDRQLKIRGHRVEPEEIERALRSLPGITHAHVSLERTEGSEPRLIAFVILQPGADPHRLHDACRALLPLPMVPAAIVPLESFPLTANGKIDAHALGRAAARGAPKQPAPPETAAQKLVADIWREVLERSDFGLDDNFFDLGGHSISMIEVHARLRASGAEVQLLEMFRHPTVRALAERITHSPAAAAPLSPAQERARARLRLGGGAGPRKD